MRENLTVHSDRMKLQVAKHLDGTFVKLLLGNVTRQKGLKSFLRGH